MYYLVVIDDYSRFSWVFFLETKDETSRILKAFVTGMENLIDHKVQIIRCDNGTEFKNKEMNELCEKKEIKRKFSVARTPQQNVNTKFKPYETILVPCYNYQYLRSSSSKDSPGDGFKPLEEEEKKDAKDPENEDNEVLSTKEPRVNQEKDANVNITNNINTISPTANAASIKYNDVDKDIVYGCANDLNMPNLEEINYSDDDDDVGVEADMTNLDSNISVSHIPTTRIHKDHPVKQIIGDIHLAPQTRRMTKNVTNYGMVKGDIILVQVYVDDIIFGSTRKEMCTEFEKMMHKKFQMSSIGEPAFFLGLQVTQKDDGIFISQDKYVHEILTKFGFSTVKTTSTPMETSKPLLKDENAGDVDVHLYRLMIGSLIIFRYLKGQPKLDLWYPKDLPFDLESYTNSDYSGASLDMKSTTEEYVSVSNCCGHVLWIQNQLLDYGYNIMNTKIFIDNESIICIVKNPVFHSKTKHIEIRHRFIRDSNEKKLIQMIKIHTDHNVAGKLKTAVDVNAVEEQIQALMDKKKVIITKTSVRSDLQLEDDEGGVKFLMFPRFVKVFLDKKVKGMFKHKEIYVIPFHTKKVFANMKRQIKDFSGRVTPLFLTMIVQAQEELSEDTKILTETQHTPTIIQPTTSQPQRKQKPRKTRRKDIELPQTSVPTKVVADEAVYKEMYDSVKRAVTTANGLDAEVLALETTKTNQALEIGSSKRRAKKLEKKASKRTHKLNRLYKIGSSRRIESSNEASFGLLDDEEVVAEKEVSTADPVTTAGEVVTTVGVKVSVAATTPIIFMDDITLAKALVALKSAKPMVKEPSVPISAASTSPKNSARLARQKEEEANIALIVEWDDVQAMIDADHELAERLQAEEQGELTIKERSKLFVELMNERKKHSARLRAEEKRRKPPTKAQKRNQMCTYLKNVAGFTHSQLKNKSFKEVQKDFDNTISWINSFVPMDKAKLDEKVEAEVDSDQEEAEMKMYMKIVPDDEIEIDAIPLATKPPIIVD
nr:hypothetical protein [Tanacetum cinerariifolium]